jgi:hypothetical protein
MSKDFIYLIQSDHAFPFQYQEIASDDCDVVLLTFQREVVVPGVHTIFFPGSTWNTGRNRLLEEARRLEQLRGRRYRYFILLDDDVELRYDESVVARFGIDKAGGPYRTFERYLQSTSPAVGYARFAWQHLDPAAVFNTNSNFDALFNAYHRDVVDLLLPYVTEFDHESWWYSQYIVIKLCDAFLNHSRWQFNFLVASNTRSDRYAQRQKDWDRPWSYLMSNFQGVEFAQGLQEQNAAPVLPGTASYAEPVAAALSRIDPSGSFFKSRFPRE